MAALLKYVYKFKKIVKTFILYRLFEIIVKSDFFSYI